MPVVVLRQVRGSDSADTVEVPQVQYFDRVVDVLAAVHRQGLDVSCDPAAAGSRRQSEVPQIQFVLDHDGCDEVFGAFCAIFRVPPVFRS